MTFPFPSPLLPFCRVCALTRRLYHSLIMILMPGRGAVRSSPAAQEGVGEFAHPGSIRVNASPCPPHVRVQPPHGVLWHVRGVRGPCG